MGMDAGRRIGRARCGLFDRARSSMTRAAATLVQRQADGYTLVDAGFTQTLARGIEIAFDVTNLFDQLYDQSYALPREGRAALPSLRRSSGLSEGLKPQTMVNEWFVVHEGLIGAARIPSLARSRQRVSALELLLLLSSGAGTAAAVGMVKLGLGIPGHSIVLAALPMAFGMSMAPRRLAGSVMSAGALGTAGCCGRRPRKLRSGAFASLALLGPMMDLALRGARRGWRVYAALVLAVTATNLTALASRAAAKLAGPRLAGARPFDSWWLQAMGTYTPSGLVAGLLGAFCWFHFNDRSRPRRLEAERRRDLHRDRRHRRHRQPGHQPAGARHRPAPGSGRAGLGRSAGISCSSTRAYRTPAATAQRPFSYLAAATFPAPSCSRPSVR